eukprot:Lankesteria_metandrocarpae@DN4665_c0_g1_i1.p1
MREAAEVGRRAVEYFYGQSFSRWVTRNADAIGNTVLGSQILESRPLEEAPAALIAELIRGGFVYRARVPDSAKQTSASSSGEREKSRKWPKQLELSPMQSFEPEGYYVVCYEGSQFKRHALLAAIISAVLVICMFPAWPFLMKLAVWYLSVVLLTIILFIVLLRLVLFVVMWFFGCDYWFFPNLFDEDAGVIDSFIPTYSFAYRADGWLMFAARIFLALLSVLGVRELGKTHSVSDVGDFAKQQFLDVLDWGHQKLAPPPDVGTFNAGGANGGIDPFIRAKPVTVGRSRRGQDTAEDTVQDEDHEMEEEVVEHEDYGCVSRCGFSSFDELLEECVTDCQCMEELIKSPCYPRCPDNTKRALDEARLDACAAVEEEQSNLPQDADSTADGAVKFEAGEGAELKPKPQSTEGGAESLSEKQNEEL